MKMMIDVEEGGPSAVEVLPTETEGRRPLLRRPPVVAALVVVGLLVGFGVAYLAFRPDPAPSVFAGEPSVTTFDLPASPVTAPPTATVPPTVAVEPANARAALEQYLRAEIARDFPTSFALLDADTRTEAGPVASWQNTRANRLLPEEFSIVSEAPVDDGVEITITASRAPAVSPLTGLVPARSTEKWRVVKEEGWRIVAGRPADVRPQLPSDEAAQAAAASWLERAAACDTNGAVAEQLSPNLLGSPQLREATCKNKGTWTAGAAVPVSELPNPTVFVSAYGPGVGRWARAVPVSGAGRYTIVLAPLGDEWRVMGVIPEGSPRP